MSASDLKLLQDWTTLVGSGTTPIVQSLADWADFAKLADAVFWLEVRAVENPGTGAVECVYETAPVRDARAFGAMATETLTPGAGPILTAIRLADAPAVPLARWVRWKLQGTDAGAWSATFRLFATGGRSSGPGFNPKSIPNLALWLRSDKGITLDGSGNVDAWADQSGVGDANQDLGPAASASRPIYTSSNAAFAGRPTLGTTPSTDEARGLASGTWTTPLAQPATWYQVFRLPAGGADLVYLRLSTAGAAADCHALYGTPTTLKVETGSLTPISFSVSADDVHVVCVIYDGSSAAVYVDDATTTTATGNTGSDTCQTLFTGTWSGEESQYEQAELLAYGGAHDEATRRKIMKALGTRYGVTIA